MGFTLNLEPVPKGCNSYQTLSTASCGWRRISTMIHWENICCLPLVLFRPGPQAGSCTLWYPLWLLCKNAFNHMSMRFRESDICGHFLVDFRLFCTSVTCSCESEYGTWNCGHVWAGMWAIMCLKKQEQWVNVFTFIKCLFTHFVKVFFCTRSRSSAKKETTVKHQTSKTKKK